MPATLFLLLSSWIPWPPSLCCTESEDSSDFELSEFLPATALTTQDWAYPASTKTEDTEYHLLHSKYGGKQQDGVMSSDRCLSSFGARLFVLAFWFPWFPGSLRCVAQNPRILLMVNLIQRIHYSYACASFFSLPFYFLIETRCNYTLSLNRVQVQTLPTAQVPSALTDAFSWGHDPLTPVKPGHKRLLDGLL